jgi:ankyrin repeat protein
MRQIHKKGNRARAGALKALQWILCVERPLSCGDLVQAIDEATETTLTTSDIVDLCNNLVVIDVELNVFRFAHLSVREYLESRDDFSSNFIHQSLALQCLQKCLSTLRTGLVSAVDFDEGRYWCYAVLYWPLHCQFAGSGLSPPIVDMLSSFLKSEERNGSTYTAWIRFVSSLKTSWIGEKRRVLFKLISSRPPHPIFLVITFDLNFFLRDTLEMLGSHENLVNSQNLSPLALACNLGRTDAARLLLGKGETVDVTRHVKYWTTKYGRWLANPLSAAVYHNHKEIVSMLLAAGAEPNIDTDTDPSPLVLAVQMGDQTLVKMLINADAIINKPSKQQADLSTSKTSMRWWDFSGPLSEAARSGDEDMCRLLLAHGADPNMTGPVGMHWPLEAASEGSHFRVVQLLHESGATVDNLQNELGTALACAAGKGSSDIVQYLLDHKANPNLETGPYGSPFLSAVASGNVDVAKIMLAHGADMNAPGNENGRALAIAIYHNNCSTFSLLLDQGANVWEPLSHDGSYFNNALEFAAYEGKFDILQQVISSARNRAKGLELGRIFLAAVRGRGGDRKRIIEWLHKNGADVNSKLSDGKSALHIAVNRSEVALIHQLLSYGAEINSVSNSEGSVLQVLFGSLTFNDGRWPVNERSVVRGPRSSEVFEILVEADVDINATGGELGDSLQAAASSGETEVIYQLLNLGAKLNIDIGKYGSAIHAAASCGHAASAVAVLTSGIDPNIICEPYGTPLQAAACRGRTPASQLLDLDVEFRTHRLGDTNFDHQIDTRKFKDTFNALLEAGADVHCYGGQFGTALQAAAYVGDEEMVKDLLYRKANPLAKGGFYGTVLQAVAAGEADSWWAFGRWAFRRRSSEDSVVLPAEEDEPEPDHHANTMEILLKAGADISVNEECGFFGTSLQAAVHSDNPVLVRKLLKAGAKVTEDGKGHYGGCISAAVGFGKCKLIDLVPESFHGNSAEILRLLLQYIPEQDFVRACHRAVSRARQNRNEEGLDILLEVFPEIARERGITEEAWTWRMRQLAR